MAKLIEDLKLVDLTQYKPQQRVSTISNTMQAQIEQSRFDIEYQEELHHYFEKIDTLEQGLYKAYALIFHPSAPSSCNHELKSIQILMLKLKMIQLYCSKSPRF